MLCKTAASVALLKESDKFQGVEDVRGFMLNAVGSIEATSGELQGSNHCVAWQACRRMSKQHIVLLADHALACTCSLTRALKYI